MTSCPTTTPHGRLPTSTPPTWRAAACSARCAPNTGGNAIAQAGPAAAPAPPQGAQRRRLRGAASPEAWIASPMSRPPRHGQATRRRAARASPRRASLPAPVRQRPSLPAPVRQRPSPSLRCSEITYSILSFSRNGLARRPCAASHHRGPTPTPCCAHTTPRRTTAAVAATPSCEPALAPPRTSSTSIAHAPRTGVLAPSWAASPT